MDLGDRAMLSITQLTDHADNIQAKLTMRQRPSPFFFCTIRQMVQVTVLVAAAPHDQSQTDQSSERHQGPLGMVGHPQSLSTTDAFLGAWGEAHFSWCGGTSFSSSHFLAPPFGNYSATLLRKRLRLSFRVERTSSTVSADTRPVAPIHLKNFLNEAR